MENEDTVRDVKIVGDYIITIDKKKSGELHVSDVSKVMDGNKLVVDYDFRNSAGGFSKFTVDLWTDEKHNNGKRVIINSDNKASVQVITRGAGKVTDYGEVDLDNKNEVIAFLKSQGVPNPEQRWNELEEMKKLLPKK